MCDVLMDLEEEIHQEQSNMLAEEKCQKYSDDKTIGLGEYTFDNDRFEKIITANTGLPTGKAPLSDGFAVFREFLQIKPDLHVAGQVRNGTTKGIDENALAAYNAPFPSDDHKQGVRQFPNLVPGTLRTPSAEPNKEAWKILREWNKPFLCAFSDKDPIFAGVENSFYKLVPGCEGTVSYTHLTLPTKRIV